jgi:hypothetical protein
MVDWNLRTRSPKPRSALPCRNSGGLAKRHPFKLSLFHTATILVLVAFGGLTFNKARSHSMSGNVVVGVMFER